MNSDDASSGQTDALQILREPEAQIVAAAVMTAFSAPLGLAAAAGTALRSPRVRAALRGGAVQTLATAMEAGERLRRAASNGSAEPPAAKP